MFDIGHHTIVLVAEAVSVHSYRRMVALLYYVVWRRWGCDASSRFLLIDMMSYTPASLMTSRSADWPPPPLFSSPYCSYVCGGHKTALYRQSPWIYGDGLFRFSLVAKHLHKPTQNGGHTIVNKT